MPLCRRRLGIILDPSALARECWFARTLGFGGVLCCAYTLPTSYWNLAMEIFQDWWASAADYSHAVGLSVIVVYDVNRLY